MFKGGTLQMKSIDYFADLMCCDSVEDWRDLIIKRCHDLGYEQILLAVFPDRNTPLESELAFLHSNFCTEWRGRYDAQKLWYIDPAVAHCTSKSLPLIWSPNIFYTKKQKEMYEEACGYGLRSGVALPIHGPHGEVGILCFMTNMKSDNRFHQKANNMFPELSYIRDLIFESSLRFMDPSKSTEDIHLITHCELECLKWCAKGKSSGDIAQILHCSVAAVNFHFTSLRTKFNVSSRHLVVVKALHYGLIKL
jgi:LuxR family quorum-sensing transcriptional regulator LasR